MAAECPYAVLSVAPDAALRDITVAYRKLARKWHPDKNEGQESAIFISIQLAYEVLSDPATRRAYDLRYGTANRRQRPDHGAAAARASPAAGASASSAGSNANDMPARGLGAEDEAFKKMEALMTKLRSMRATVKKKAIARTMLDKLNSFREKWAEESKPQQDGDDNIPHTTNAVVAAPPTSVAMEAYRELGRRQSRDASAEGKIGIDALLKANYRSAAKPSGSTALALEASEMVSGR